MMSLKRMFYRPRHLARRAGRQLVTVSTPVSARGGAS